MLADEGPSAAQIDVMRKMTPEQRWRSPIAFTGRCAGTKRPSFAANIPIGRNHAWTWKFARPSAVPEQDLIELIANFPLLLWSARFGSNFLP